MTLRTFPGGIGGGYAIVDEAVLPPFLPVQTSGGPAVMPAPPVLRIVPSHRQQLQRQLDEVNAKADVADTGKGA